MSGLERKDIKKLPRIENPEEILKMAEENEAKPKEPKFWRSLNVLNNSQSQDVVESKKQEFPEGQDQELNIDAMDPVSRRKFLALMTASGVFATTACTDYRDKGQIYNYTKKPEEIQPGIANYYASTIASKGKAWGVLIKTREGRPIRVDGNPEHPISKGKLDVSSQAVVVDLYDPDRLKAPITLSTGELNIDRMGDNKFTNVDWAQADKDIIAKLNSAVASGKEIAILANNQTSPTAVKLFEVFKAKFPTANFYFFDQINDNNRNSAWMKSYGEDIHPGVQLDKADIILSLECDFLGSDGDQVENTRLFTSRRDVNDAKNFNRLYQVEGAFSQTGGLADYRMRLRPEHMQEFALSIASHLIASGKSAAAMDVDLSSYNLDSFIKSHGLVAKKVNKLIDDLVHSKGKAIVMGGRQLSEDAHIAINLLNEVLGSTGLYNSKHASVTRTKSASSNDIKSVIADMNSGKVAVLINYDSNPVYHLPKTYKFEEALSKVETVISLTMLENESSINSNYRLPINHDFESWGDHEVRSGVLSLQQPVINPLYDTRQKEDILLSWINNGEYSFDSYHKYMMKRWESNVYTSIAPMSSFKDFWVNALHDGVVNSVDTGRTQAPFNTSALKAVSKNSKIGYTIILNESPVIGDGRNANNGFLQETPHPVTKVTWDNVASISANTAKEIDCKNGDIINVEVSGRSLEMPALIQPGMADGVIAIDLGYGRKVGGQIGTDVGFDAATLMEDFGHYIITGAIALKTGNTHKIASTQEHHMLDDQVGEKVMGDGNGYKIAEFHKERQIIQEGTVEDYLHDPSHIVHRHHTKSIMENHDYPDIKWAMAIDMNKCTGCNACITSCNVESNIPVVGKTEVLMGREMQWMRLDRYYSGSQDEPRMSIQPMLCQHCDNAPCENVCPVVATTHSPDGINQMVYNRCVGTRYCANNCPYKVRRFNFFDFRDRLAEGFYYSQSMQQMYNPEVSIRSRGVMEKCDFCTSRISEARSLATKEGRELKGSDVVTACQEACPANAIYFGDMNDPESEVSKLREHDLGYHVLEILDVKPAVTYIAKLINKETEKDHSEGNNGH